MKSISEIPSSQPDKARELLTSFLNHLEHSIHMDQNPKCICSLNSNSRRCDLDPIFQEAFTGSFEKSQDVQTFLIDLIQDSSEFHMMCYLDMFFERVSDKIKLRPQESDKFSCYCAKAKHILHKYFSQFFRKLLEKWAFFQYVYLF